MIYLLAYVASSLAFFSLFVFSSFVVFFLFRGASVRLWKGMSIP